MKKCEKLSYLKETNFGLFVDTRNRVAEELSERQPWFCCCGSLATSLHEAHCKKFNDKIDAEVIRRLRHLLPKS